MFLTAAEERLAKKIGLEHDYHAATEQQREHDLPIREPPAGTGTLGSPHISSPSDSEWDFDTPHSPPSTPGSFISIEDLIRIPSNKSCDSADFFPVRAPGGPGDLMNPIHPIFRKRNAHGEARRRYDNLRPSLQLASKFIQTESMLPFWYAVFFTETAPVKKLWHSSGEPAFEFLDAPNTLTYTQIQQTHYALRKLAKRVRFTIFAGHRPHGDESDSFTLQRRKNNDARIFISRRWLREHREAVRRRDHARYLWHTFRLASNMCHELAHAAVRTVHGEVDCYFPGARVAEDGFEWEHRHMGGVVLYKEPHGTIDYYPGSPKLSLWLLPWPNPFVVGDYVSRDNHISIRERYAEDDVAVRVKGGTIEVEWLTRYFQESFWRDEVEERGPEATKFPFVDKGVRFPLTEAQRDALLPRKGLRLQEQSKRKGGVFDGVDLGLRSVTAGKVYVTRKRKHRKKAARVRVRMRGSRLRVLSVL